MKTAQVDKQRPPVLFFCIGSALGIALDSTILNQMTGKINVYWVKRRQIVLSSRNCAALSCLSKQKSVRVIILRNAAQARRAGCPAFLRVSTLIVSIDNIVPLGAIKRNLKIGSLRHWISLWCWTGYACIEVYERCMDNSTKNPTYLCRTTFD